MSWRGMRRTGRGGAPSRGTQDARDGAQDRARPIDPPTPGPGPGAVPPLAPAAASESYPAAHPGTTASVRRAPGGPRAVQAAATRALWRAGLRRVERLAEPPLAFALHVPERVIVAPPDILDGDPARAEAIYGGTVRLAGHTVETGGASPFAIRDAPSAWVRALHGFGWLRHAQARGDALARAHARALCADWFREYGHPDRSTAWQPTVAAMRTRHWLAHSPVLLTPVEPAPDEAGAGPAAEGTALDAGAPPPEAREEGGAREGRVEPDAGFDDRFLRQLALHRRFLRRAARHIGDPLARLHVLASLCTAALALPTGRDEQQRLGTALAAELGDQVLRDGGHVSRRASVGVDLLTALLPLRRCYVARGLVAPSGLLTAIDRMVPALLHHRLGDGSLARHNGTHGVRRDRLDAILALELEPDDPRLAPPPAPGPDALGPDALGPDAPRRLAPRRGLGEDGVALDLPESGYERLSAGGTVVLADMGPLPPVEHAARAHAGALSFEMSVGSHALVVNLGAVDEEGDEVSDDGLARALRSTAAHSTLAVEGASSARIVAGPTVRRLFGEAMVDGPATVELRRADAENGRWRGLRATHDGFRERGVAHERTLTLVEGGAVLRGQDRMVPVLTDAERAEGTAGTPPARRMPEASVRFHLHPDVRATREGADVVLRVGEGTPGAQAWRFVAGVPPRLEETLFCDAAPVPSRQIVLPLRGDRRDVAWSFERIEPARA